MPIAKPEKTDIDRNKIENALNFILNEKFITVVEQYKAETQKNVVSVDEDLNIFTIISKHKTIDEPIQNSLLYVILNHTCKNHSGRKIFLHKFIEHINQLPKLPNKDEEPSKNNLITPSDFEDACVEREKYYRDSTGKMWIDVLITSKKSKKAIIIESKLNYAKDQKRQIPRYYEAVVEDGYEVVGIIYIPCNKEKSPIDKDWENKDITISPLLRIFPGYDEQGHDLKKWLGDCEKLYSKDDLMNSGEQNNESRNAATILNQYGAWLQAEREKNAMDEKQKQDSYKKLLDAKVSRSRLDDAQQLISDLAEGEAHYIFDEWKNRFFKAGFADDTVENGSYVASEREKKSEHWWVYFTGLKVNVKQGDKTRKPKPKLEVWIQLAMPEDSKYSYRVFIATSRRVNQSAFEELVNTIWDNPICMEKEPFGNDYKSFYHDIPRGESLEADQKELEKCLKNLLNKLDTFKA